MSTLNPSPLPDASSTTRGAVSTLAQSFAGIKTFVNAVILSAGLQINGVLASATNYLTVLQATFAGSTFTGDSILNFGHGNNAFGPQATLILRNTVNAFGFTGKAVGLGVGPAFVDLYWDDTAGFIMRRTSRASLDAGGLGASPVTVFYVSPDGATSTFYNSLQTNTANAWSTAQRGAVTALTSSSGSIAINLAATNNYSHTLTENTTLAAPTNPVAGQSGCIVFTQHASSPKTLAFNSFWKFAGGTVPTLTASNGAVDVLTYYVCSSGFAVCQLIKGVA